MKTSLDKKPLKYAGVRFRHFILLIHERLHATRTLFLLDYKRIKPWETDPSYKVERLSEMMCRLLP